MGKNVEKSKTKKTEVKKKPLSLKERNKAIRELSKEVNRKSYLRFMEDLIVSSISKCDITPTSNISIKNNFCHHGYHILVSHPYHISY